ncbi:signal recognition particle-docking protein FtsY [Melioribacteraceae bacterium 4301-Me]|uniref:signal recognition particle-docking protein FtsY n=1 Tax=Pyranulibacter aquaticus TaxID=3163344 RepID=UPI00359B39C6
MNLTKSLSFIKIKNGLARTKEKLIGRINEIFNRKDITTEEALENIEEILISSDVGVELTEAIIDKMRSSLKNNKNISFEDIKELLKSKLTEILTLSGNKNEKEFDLSQKPYVILISGVNGVGKTTTIGKLAYNFKIKGYNVIIGAADTFRAAANEQLEIWAKRANVEIIQGKAGADPSSIAFTTIQEAIKNNYDIVLLDTAGRLHTKVNLMQELQKMNKTINKILPYAPNETFLVIDATTGQNALAQVSEFSKYISISGLIINKLDGTAKGGVIFRICHENKIPVKYLGTGEKIDDLQEFNSEEFVTALFE